MDMDMVRPSKDLWGLSPDLRPWEAWASLTDLCGCSQPVRPPSSSCDVNVGPVCHCHCGGDRRSRHPVRLVWVNRSFGCRTIAARTQDLILYMLPVFTSISRSYLSVFTEFHRLLGSFYRFCGEFMSCGDPDPSVDLGRHPPPAAVLGTRCHAVVRSSPPMVCSKQGGEGVPRNPWPIGQMSVLPRYPCLFPVLLVAMCFLGPIGNWQGTNPVPNLPHGLNRSGIFIIST